MKKFFSINVAVILLVLSISGIGAQTPDFTDTHGDGTLTGWTSRGTRTWSESGGYAVPQNGTQNAGFLISNFASAADGAIEVNITADQWNGQSGGIVLRWTSAQSYYFIAVKPGNQWDNYIKFCKNTTIADSGRTVASRFSMGTTFTLRVELQGATFRFYIDGVYRGEITDASYSTGSFGYAYGPVWNMYTRYSEIRWWNAAPTQYPLTIALNGNGSVDPSGGNFPVGTVVSVTATPAAGWAFSNWTGSIQSTSNPLSVTMNSAVNLTANFTQLPVYDLSVVTTGNGTVAPSSGSYVSGTSVTVTATPQAGWVFSNWSGDAQGTSNPLTVTMNANKNITAVFTQIPVYNLAVTANGNGSVNPETGSYIQGTAVTITATPSAGWVFSSWSGDAQGTSNPLTVTMNANMNITAVFTQIPVYSLSVTTNGNGAVSPENGNYQSGTDVEITATPAAGWVFSNWSGDITGLVNPVIVRMNSSKSIVANFVQITHTLTTETEGNGTVQPDDGEYPEGTNLTVSATPAAGWTFTNWTGDLQGSTNPATLLINSDKLVVAHFSQITHTLTVTADGNGTVSPAGGTYPEGTTVELTATAEPGWYFDHWSGDLTGSVNPASVTMDGTKNITAHFSQRMYTLTVTAGEHGSVAPQTVTVPEGTTVTITATPDQGFVFDRWTGDATGSQNPLQIVMNGNKTVAAVFAEYIPSMYNLVTSVNGNGSINPASGRFVEGTTVEISAEPATGWIFHHWEGDLSGTVTPANVTFNADKTIRAVFVVDNQSVPNSRKIAISADAFNSNGDPLGNDQPVTVDLTVRLYDASVNGNLVYSEQFAAANNQGITIDKGHFTARMGEGLTSDDLVNILSQYQSLWVEIAIGTNVLSRIPLTSAPYSLR